MLGKPPAPVKVPVANSAGPLGPSSARSASTSLFKPLPATIVDHAPAFHRTVPVMGLLPVAVMLPAAQSVGPLPLSKEQSAPTRLESPAPRPWKNAPFHRAMLGTSVGPERSNVPPA